MGFPPSLDATGDIESMNLLAGQSVGLVREIKPAATVVHELIAEASEIIARRLGAMSGKN
jgi:nitronate monooxygenase